MAIPSEDDARTVRAYSLLYRPYGPLMAQSTNSALLPLGWSAMSAPDDATVHQIRHHEFADVTELTRCGVEWDAVVIAPLERGLRCLDLLGLPLDAGCPVIADYVRGELVVQVALGTGGAAAGLPGVRVLSEDSWLLVPSAGRGAYPAVWLSLPSPGRYVDVAALREALLGAEEERTEQGRRQLHEAPATKAPPPRAH
jgi:hypothetical protein